MPNVQIKGVPETAHKVLRQRADAAGQSLQEYMLKLILDQTSRPTVDEALASLDQTTHAHVSVDDVNDILRIDRARP